MISVIIPSFNKASFIAETIKSVQSQNLSNWELLIIDDGSTDNSIAIIQEFCNSDERIKLHQRTSLPKGGSACRNIGLQKAQGEYIIFLDADDVLLDSCIAKRLFEIEKFPNNNFWVFPIGTFYKHIGDSNSVWFPKGNNFLIRFLKHDLPWHTMSVVWRKKFIEELNGFDTDYPRLQDVELHTRALLKNNVSLKTFPENAVDAYYRIDAQRSNQNLGQQLNKQKEGVLLYLKKIRPLIIKKDHISALNGTIFSFVTTLNYSCLVINNEIDLYSSIYQEIVEFLRKQQSPINWRLKFLNTYVQLYKYGFWKIKGFNFVMKFLFCK